MLKNTIDLSRLVTAFVSFWKLASCVVLTKSSQHWGNILLILPLVAGKALVHSKHNMFDKSMNSTVEKRILA